MKKKLIASCRVRPYTSGAAIDRQNFGSAVLGLKVAAATGSPTAATLKLALTESDTSSGTFAAVSDKQALIGGLLDADGAVTMDIPVTGSEAQIGIDLTGCKRFVKITGTVSFTGGTTPAGPLPTRSPWAILRRSRWSKPWERQRCAPMR